MNLNSFISLNTQKQLDMVKISEKISTLIFNYKLEKICAKPKIIKNIEDCYFYHTTDIPGYGLIKGEWDLQAGINDYLGHVDFKGKRVLDVGTASGFLCFHMEKMGAEVIAYDLGEKDKWDAVPYWRYDYEQFINRRKNRIAKLHNSFWFCHKAFNSKAKVVYGSAYNIPKGIGEVDISVLGSILLHLKDPFLALYNILKITKETIIIVDAHDFEGDGLIQFLPRIETCKPKETWWRFSPQSIVEFIKIFGFEDVKVNYHTQSGLNGPINLFTVVGHRVNKLGQ
jgi:SAM-dependent methyltransferase